MALPSFICITKGIEGGYVPIREGHLDALAIACRGPLLRDRFALRAWAAQLEVRHRLLMDEDDGLEEGLEESVLGPDFEAAVARLMRTSKRVVARRALRRLARAEAAPYALDDSEVGGRIVPVPRRGLRRLAGGASAGALAVYLHACKRGSFKYGSKLHLGGLLRAMDAARTWGLDPSSVKRGRAELVALGLLQPVPLGRRFESANGWAFRLPDDWEDPNTAGAEHDEREPPRREPSAPPTPNEQGAEWIRPTRAPAHGERPSCGVTSGTASASEQGTQRTTPGTQRTTPGNPAHHLGNPAHHLQLPSYEDPPHQDPLNKHPGAAAPRAPLKGGKGKSPKAGGSEAHTPAGTGSRLRVSRADLETPAGREALCERAARDPGVAAVWKSEAGRLAIHALAAQVLARAGIRKPCAVVAGWLHRDELHSLTQAEEEDARHSRAEALDVHADHVEAVESVASRLPLLGLDSPPARFPAEAIRALGQPTGSPAAPSAEPHASTAISPEAAAVAAAFDERRRQRTEAAS